MPSFGHEFFVELFRNRPELACELLAQAGVATHGDHVELGSVDLSQVVPVEYRADAVIVMRDPAEAVVGAVVVEVQLRADTGKRWSWPQYVTALRARLECTVLLLVLASESSVAVWARQPIETGHPGFALTPIVIELADIPRLATVEQGHRYPELAVLSVIAHPELEAARLALEVISTLPADRADLYFDVILGALPEHLANRIGADVLKNYEYQSKFMRKLETDIRATAMREGRDEGLREGRDEGLREGRDEGLREALLRVARVRIPHLTPALETRIVAVASNDVVQELFDAILRAPDAEAAVAAIERLAP